MRRTWKHAVIVCGALLAPSTAHAFHAGKVYDKLPGAGGGGGLFYAGTPLERGMTCAACHTNAPGKISINLNDASNKLFTSFTYTPGTTYPLTATLDGDTTSIDHFNAIVVSIVDDGGNTVGAISAFDPTSFYLSATGTLASDSTTPNLKAWTFSWTAPQTNVGRVHLHVASVAGNSAGIAGLKSTDPWGDDVFVGALDLDPEGTTASRDANSSSSYALLACAFFLKRRRSS